MRPSCLGRSVPPPLVLSLWAVLVFNAPAVYAQSAAGPGRMSLGSTWTRHGDSQRATMTGRTSTVFRPVAGAATRFFGGVTVGRGFYPFYYPGHIGFARYCEADSTDPLSYIFGTPGLQISVGSTRFGPFYHGIGLVLPPYYYGGPTGHWGTSRASSRTSIGRGANRTSVSHWRTSETPRVEFSSTFERPVTQKLWGRIDFTSIKRQVRTAVDKSPVVGEFAATATGHRRVTASDKLESQRLQTHGDRALCNEDPELARTFYQAAVRADPSRQTPWLRMTWVHVIQREFPKAAAAIKRALMISHDTATGCMTADQLLHNSPSDRSWLSDAGLWIWLQDRPDSVDRLLLVAGYMHFLGHNHRVTELLDLAHTAGISQSSFEALSRITQNHRDSAQSKSVESQTFAGHSPDQVSVGSVIDPGELAPQSHPVARTGKRLFSSKDSAGENEVAPTP